MNNLFGDNFFKSHELDGSGKLLKAKEDKTKIGDSDYPEPLAGKPHPLVQKVIALFFRMSKKERDKTTLWVWLLGDTTQYLKPEQASDSIKYVDVSTKQQNCGNCNSTYFHLASKTHICSIVKRQIFPEGYCIKWNKAEKDYKFKRT